MFDFELLKEEEIVLTTDNIVITRNGKNTKYSAVLTNKRLIFFDKLNDSLDSLNISTAIGAVPTLFPQEEIELSTIKSIDFDDDKDKYILKDGNHFYLYDEDIKLEIKNQLNI